MSSLPFTEFTADGFRGLRSLEVKDLRGINVFVGGNNSGKTSVLEVVSLLANAPRPIEWAQMVRRRDHGRLDESLVISLMWCFAQSAGEDAGLSTASTSLKPCVFTSNGRHAIRRMESRYSESVGLPDAVNDSDRIISGDETPALVRHGTVTSRLEWEPSQTAIGGDLAREHASVSVTVSDESSLWSSAASFPADGRTGVPCATLLPYSYQFNSAQVSAHSFSMFARDSDSLLLELMQQFDPDVMRVQIGSISGRRSVIYVKHKRLGVAPLSVFGDAMRRCHLLASTLAGLSPGGVLLLDEIEAGIHIDSLPKVFKWLAEAARKAGVQVFATTHSLEVLDALLAAEVGEEDLAAYRIKQSDDRTECQRFSFDSLKRLRYERGLDIR